MRSATSNDDLQFLNKPGTLEVLSRDGCEDSRKFVSGTPLKLVNWLTQLVNSAG